MQGGWSTGDMRAWSRCRGGGEGGVEHGGHGGLVKVQGRGAEHGGYAGLVKCMQGIWGGLGGHAGLVKVQGRGGIEPGGCTVIIGKEGSRRKPAVLHADPCLFYRRGCSERVFITFTLSYRRASALPWQPAWTRTRPWCTSSLHRGPPRRSRASQTQVKRRKEGGEGGSKTQVKGGG